MKAIHVASACPMCHEQGQVTLLNTPLEVPHFGDALETTLACAACGFRHADFMILSQKDPLRLTFEASGEDALRVRVIRSNSGTIRIPELGFTAEPTPLSESFVSNVEGVLERARGILQTALNWHGDDPAKRELLESYLENHQRILMDGSPFTLVIEDPFGNSAIVSESVKRETLSEEEVAHLKTGMIVFDVSEMGGAEGENEGSGAASREDGA